MDIPGELPKHCYGLIPCTPLPTLGPHGLTHEEAMGIGVAYGTLISVSAVLILLILVVAFSLAVYGATAHRN